MNLKIVTSIFLTFMKALFNYLLSFLRGVANMSAPAYERYQCTPALRQTRFWSHTRMWDTGQLLPAPDQQKIDGNYIMDTFKPQQLAAISSLQLVADTVSQVLNQCITTSEMPMDNLDSLNICEEPSFCYFFINMRPESHDCFKSKEEVFDHSTNDTNNNDDQTCYPSLYDGSQKVHCERQRCISECSDDSFICFEDSSESEISSYDEDDLDAISNKCGCECAGKKVRFDLKPKIHVMRVWDFAYRAARKADWQVYVRDRARFQQRIKRVSDILNPVLNCSHREQVFKERFLEIL